MVVEVVAGRHPGHGDIDHADGNEDAGLVAADGGVEVFRSDAEDGERMAVDEHGLADDVARSGEAGLPVAVAEDGDGICIFGCVVLLREQAAKRGLQAEKLKVVAGDNFGVLVSPPGCAN